MAKQQGTDLDNVAVGSNSKRAKPEDKVPLFKFKDGVWYTFRLVGPIFTYGTYWVKTKTKANTTPSIGEK